MPKMLLRTVGDLGTFTSMLTNAGIEYKLTVVKGGVDISLIAKEHKKVGGYHGFETIFHFDDKGQLIEVGCWE